MRDETMNWSGLSPIAARIFGIVIFTNAFVAIVRSSPIWAAQISELFAKGHPAHDYWFVLPPILPSLLYSCIGLLFLTSANRIASRFGDVETAPAERAELNRLEGVLISVAGLYFLADAAVEVARVFAGTIYLANRSWSWEALLAASLGNIAGAAAKAAIGFIFIVKRNGLSSFVQKARDWPA